MLAHHVLCVKKNEKKQVGGADMLAHHVLCIGFWGGGLLDNVSDVRGCC